MNVNEWIRAAPPVREPGDLIGNALFRLNKALLVYVVLPVFLVIGASYAWNLL